MHPIQQEYFSFKNQPNKLEIVQLIFLLFDVVQIMYPIADGSVIDCNLKWIESSIHPEQWN